MDKSLLCLGLVLLGLAAAIAAPVRGDPRRRPETRNEQMKYLQRFNHWHGKNDSNDTDVFRKSVKGFQRYNSLNQTGEVDDETKELMSRPRCGLPDDNPAISGRRRRRRYSLYQYVQWGIRNFTYYFRNFTQDLPADVQRSDAARAFQYWSDVALLNFTEIYNSSALVQILYAVRNHGDGIQNAFDGPGGVLAHTFYPRNGSSHFDDDETWTHGVSYGTNLLQVMTHEFGHALGLQHSTDTKAVMYPYYVSYDPNFALGTDDILGIQMLYGQRVSPTSSSTTLKTSTTTYRSSGAVSKSMTTPTNIPTANPPPAATTKTTTIMATATIGLYPGRGRPCPWYYRWLGRCWDR